MKPRDTELSTSIKTHGFRDSAVHTAAKHNKQLHCHAPVEVIIHNLELAQLWHGTK